MDRYGEKKSNKQKFTTIVITAAVIFVLYYWLLQEPQVEHVQKAVVVLNGNTSTTISGNVTFEQLTKDGPVTVSGIIENLNPSSLRGFHIHELGDLTDGCRSTGSHYNPWNKTHGDRTDLTRHIGDLGNIEGDKYGIAAFSFRVDLVSLNGPQSVIGRAVVVHEYEDDLGRGGNEESLKTGNAGGRSACGVIGRG